MNETPDQSSAAIIEKSERSGVLVLPVLFGFFYSLYELFVTRGRSTNGIILVILCVMFFIFPLIIKSSMRFLPAYFLGFYMFGVLGLVALGLSISERSGWAIVALAALWTILGWRLLSSLSMVRQKLGEDLKEPQ